MASAPPPPDTERDTRLDDLPVAATELEPPYRVLIHNSNAPNPTKGNRLFGVAPPAPTKAADGDRLALRERLRAALPFAIDGSIPLVARVWAVRGVR
jgi:hypothetical protein